MNIIEAIKSNKPIRRKKWVTDKFLYLEGSQYIFDKEDSNYYEFDSYDILADDWEIKQDPAPSPENEGATKISIMRGKHNVVASHSIMIDSHEVQISALGKIIDHENSIVEVELFVNPCPLNKQIDLTPRPEVPDCITWDDEDWRDQMEKCINYLYERVGEDRDE